MKAITNFRKKYTDPLFGQALSIPVRQNINDFLSGKRELGSEITSLARDPGFNQYNTGNKAADAGLKLIRDLVLNRAKQGAYILQGTRDLGMGIKERDLLQGLSGVGQIAGGAYNLTGQGTVENLAQSGLFGGIGALRNKQPVLAGISQGIGEDSLFSDAVGIKDPGVAAFGNAVSGAMLGFSAKNAAPVSKSLAKSAKPIIKGVRKSAKSALTINRGASGKYIKPVAKKIIIKNPPPRIVEEMKEIRPNQYRLFVNGKPHTFEGDTFDFKGVDPKKLKTLPGSRTVSGGFNPFGFFRK